MPNKDKHVAIGVLVGSGIAAYRAREQEFSNLLLEAVGGMAGGYFGSRLPDIIEPASWPGHRQLAHSAFTGYSFGHVLYKAIEKWEGYFRSQSEIYNVKTQEATHQLQKLFYTILEVCFRILVGCLSGLGAGYISHLYSDGCTPSGLPLFQ